MMSNSLILLYDEYTGSMTSIEYAPVTTTMGIENGES